MCKLRRESHMGDRDIVKNEVESQGTLCQILPHKTWYLYSHKKEYTRPSEMTYMFTLGDKLTSIELRNYTFQNLVHDGRQNSFIVILAQFAENRRETLDRRSREYTTCDIDHLQIWRRKGERKALKYCEMELTFCASQTGDVSRLSANVENDGCFKPRYLETVIHKIISHIRCSSVPPNESPHYICLPWRHATYWEDRWEGRICRHIQPSPGVLDSTVTTIN